MNNQKNLIKIKLKLITQYCFKKIIQFKFGILKILIIIKIL